MPGSAERGLRSVWRPNPSVKALGLWKKCGFTAPLDTSLYRELREGALGELSQGAVAKRVVKPSKTYEPGEASSAAAPPARPSEAQVSTREEEEEKKNEKKKKKKEKKKEQEEEQQEEQEQEQENEEEATEARGGWPRR